jgi:hypothetical protein
LGARNPGVSVRFVFLCFCVFVFLCFCVFVILRLIVLFMNDRLWHILFLSVLHCVLLCFAVLCVISCFSFVLLSYTLLSSFLSYPTLCYVHYSSLSLKAALDGQNTHDQRGMGSETEEDRGEDERPGECRVEGM